MADNSFVIELKSRADILDVVSESVALKRSGTNWVGLCPFHAEKTPSFSVSPPKQIFHCFGCGAGGDVIAFLMKRDGISFREALEVLAARYGMDVPRQNPRAVEKRDRLLSLMKSAEAFFTDHLTQDSRAQRYLRSRGLDPETISRFHIGSAPDAWRALQTHLAGLALPVDLMIQAGLLLKGERGTPYDAFRGRLIVPIRNIHGKTVAFGGRTLDDTRRPKYLNSPQSSLFNKSELLFALDLARDEIRNEGQVLVTEGYMDAVAAHQFGFRNTVATLGTALTSGHARLLKRFTPRVVLVFDGDAAGRRAARRGLPVLLAQDLEPRVLVLPEGMDPDAFLRSRGADAFRKALATAKPLVDFLVDGSLDRRDVPPHRLASEALAIVADIPDAVHRGHMVKGLAERLGIAERYLAEDLDRRIRHGRTAPGPPRTGETDAAGPAGEPERAEELLLAAAIDDPGRLPALIQGILPEDFRHPLLRRIFVRLRQFHEAGHDWSADAFHARLADDAEKSCFSRLRLEAPETPDEGTQVFQDALDHLLRRRTRDQQRTLKTQIRQGSREAMERFLEEQRRIRSRRDGET